MPPYHAKSPASSAVTPHDSATPPPQVLVTTGGVTVTVRHEPPAKPARKPDPRELFPTVIILPLDQSARDREAFIASLCAQHGPFIRELLDRRRDVLEESRKDLQQRVLMILVKHVKEVGAPANVRGFLTGVVNKEVANHKRRWRPPIRQGADVDVEMSDRPDPEGTAELHERSAKLEHYLVHLPQEEAETVRCIDLYEMTLDEAVVALGRPRSTVAAQHARAKKKLREMMSEPEPETDLGERRQGKEER